MRIIKSSDIHKTNPIFLRLKPNAPFAEPDWEMPIVDFLKSDGILSNHDKLWLILQEPYLKERELKLLGCKFVMDVNDENSEVGELVTSLIKAKNDYILDPSLKDHTLTTWRVYSSILEKARELKRQGGDDIYNLNNKNLSLLRAAIWNCIPEYKMTHTTDEDWRVTPFRDSGEQIRDVAWACRRSLGDTPESEIMQLNTIGDMISNA